jgi:hypothetical protein
MKKILLAICLTVVLTSCSSNNRGQSENSTTSTTLDEFRTPFTDSEIASREAIFRITFNTMHKDDFEYSDPKDALIRGQYACKRIHQLRSASEYFDSIGGMTVRQLVDATLATQVYCPIYSIELQSLLTTKKFKN